jgi:hypothetical protein
MAFLEPGSRKSSNIINTYSLILFADCASKPLAKVNPMELEYWRTKNASTAEANTA